ncbi:hypothetical protein AYO21_10406 [Fonsecaea monophora]|uniref:Chromo domain-containing protein n=1 Tax=Fonsecaea monophora TaxID=254056 RepID=A0A177EUU5_9EURO|nr:hypothetical protein AYO21_10406 [Fonsecaea monophora]KAH0843899.1 Chromobox protein 5 [Fonsecaea pedrosoi]OAG35396.1 hypothetical protein AYO21_10406 [Fonsecaea monophora]
MPQGFEDIGDADDIFHDPEPDADSAAKKQVNGDLKDKADEEEESPHDDNDEEEAPEAPKGKARASEDDTTGRAKEDDDDSEDDDSESIEEEAMYNVETIRNHKFQKGQVFYLIKWQGYSEKENTWEPEEHLLPHARQLLADYHEKIGGRPTPSVKRAKSKQKLRTPASTVDRPAAKRRKRNTDAPANPAEEALGTWLPDKENWEDLVAKVETVERDEAGKLFAYIKFKNGKRSKVLMDLIADHCPKAMLKFYEEHLKFK